MVVMSGGFDVIVVGARGAGSPTAMLLARSGCRVCSSTGPPSRATPCRRTSCIHRVWPRYGGGGCSTRSEPPAARPSTPTSSTSMPSPSWARRARRTRPSPTPRGARSSTRSSSGAADRAGAEVRSGFNVTDLLVEDDRVVGLRGRSAGGRTVTERAKVVIGADGMRSLVASTVQAPTYNEKPRLLAGYYSYGSGLPMDGRFETYLRPGRGFAAWPTNDDCTVVIGGWPFAEFERNRTDPECHYLAMLDLAPSFAERLAGARRLGRVVGAAVPTLDP